MQRISFAGFTLPDGAWLPPELIYLLPYISSLGQLKCSIVAIYHYMQVGGGEPLTTSDFERLTGLARQSVIDALKNLTGETGDIQILERVSVGQTYAYYPKLRLLNGPTVAALPASSQQTSPESRPVEIQRSLDSRLAEPERSLDSSTTLLESGLADPLKLRESERGDINPEVNSLSDSLNYPATSPESRLVILKDLRAEGVYLKTAQMLVERHSEAKIREHLAYYAYALERGIANGPGWLVLSLKESWGPPLGFKPKSGNRDYQRYIGGEFSEFIKH